MRFVTNTTERPRRAVFDDLRAMGFTDDVSELYTAPDAVIDSVAQLPDVLN